MKQFLINILIILGVIIISCFILQKVYQIHFTTYPSKNKLENMMRLQDKHYDLIFMGSSRVERHIDCKMITKLTGKSCANFGYSGLQLMDIDVLLSFFKKNKVTYNKVYIQVDYSYNRRNHSANFRAALIPYMNLDFVKKSLALSSNNNTSLKIPFMGYMANDVRYNLREITANLFFKRTENVYSYDIAALEGENTNVVYDFPKTFKNGHHSFEQLLKTESFKAGAMHFFISPYCPNIANRSYHAQLIKEFPFITDYTAIFDDNLKMYRDCGHLNKQGAELFTKYIIDNYMINK